MKMEKIDLDKINGGVGGNNGPVQPPPNNDSN